MFKTIVLQSQNSEGYFCVDYLVLEITRCLIRFTSELECDQKNLVTIVKMKK